MMKKQNLMMLLNCVLLMSVALAGASRVEKIAPNQVGLIYDKSTKEVDVHEIYHPGSYELDAN